MTPLPAPSSPQPFFNASGIDIEDEIWREHFARAPENRSDLISLNSFDIAEEDDEGESVLCDAFPAPANEKERQEYLTFHNMTTMEVDGKKSPYDGFPPELLEAKDENRIPKYESHTMPRIGGSSEVTPVREEGFHDDRSMLPSQSKVIVGDGVVVGARSSSLWW
jgi:metal transporter CNNM